MSLHFARSGGILSVKMTGKSYRNWGRDASLVFEKAKKTGAERAGGFA
jgi:hypothetical protein